jgi:hypothetical protein
MKNWYRQWKENLIISIYPTWKDLSEQIEHWRYLPGDAESAAS